MAKIKYQLIQEKREYAPIPKERTPNRQVLSITELTQRLRLLLESHFSSLWVEGEISNFKFHSSGHMYFSLKDENAQIACVMFHRENASLAFEPKDGMKVLCRSRVSLYAPRGQTQLMVERLQPQGVGALEIRFQQLKDKLQREGLFDPSHKKAIPFLPGKIAVVTSVDGAALHDILHVIGRRFSAAHILITPVTVQGAQAASSIAQAIKDLNGQKCADVMVLARGGGSLEDLWAFNEEVVARAIYTSSIPVISAIGHETDFTIADFVSDLRAPTPSAAAEMVLPLFEDVLARVTEQKLRAIQCMADILIDKREQLGHLTESRSLKDPLAVFEILFQRLDELTKTLTRVFHNFILSQRQKAGTLMASLEALGPLATLKRGFGVSLKLPEETLIRSVSSVKCNDQVKTILDDGFFLSRVV